MSAKAWLAKGEVVDKVQAEATFFRDLYELFGSRYSNGFEYFNLLFTLFR
jgi:hypothetical protein